MRHLRDVAAPVVPDPPVQEHDPARPLLAWLLAGEARFTVVSQRTGDHFTCKVVRTRRPHERSWSYFVWGRLWNLGLDPDLDAEDVQADGTHIPGWGYIGQVQATGDGVSVYATPRTDARGSRALRYVNWVLRRIHEGWDGTAPGVPARLLKSVKCARCRRALVDPDSLARGLGPECWKRQQGGA